MLKLLLVSRDKDRFEDLISAIKGYGDIELEFSDSGEKALAMISGKAVDLAIVDEDLGDMTGLEFVRRLLKINPMINSAVVSRLSHDDFHEASEGLGIMAQLPEYPAEKNAESLIKTLKQINGMLD
jgi:CheY-like chemotaxis protein